MNFACGDFCDALDGFLRQKSHFIRSISFHLTGRGSCAFIVVVIVGSIVVDLDRILII